MSDSGLFNVPVTYVARKSMIEPQHHNNCVDALKEIAEVSLRIIEYLSRVIR